MQHVAFSRSVAVASVALLAGLSAISFTGAQESGRNDRMPPPPPPAGETSSSRSGATDRPTPPPRQGTGATTASGSVGQPPRQEPRPPAREGSGSITASGGSATQQPPRPEERGSTGAVVCTSSGFVGEWRGPLSLQVQPGTEHEFEGRFRLLADIGADGRDQTEDDVYYDGTFYASENSDGDIEAVFTAADGTVSDYATLEFSSDSELAASISLDGTEISARSERECGKPASDKPRRPEPRGSTGSTAVAVDSEGNSVRVDRDRVEIRSASGTTVRVDSEGVQIRGDGRPNTPKPLLTDALKTQIDKRLEKIDDDNRAEFYPRVIDKLDTAIDKLDEGKKKRLYTELRDYLDAKWREEFPDDAESADEDVLDEVFSE